MKVRIVSLVFALVCVVSGALALVPVLLPPDILDMLPMHGQLVSAVAFVHDHAVPGILGSDIAPYVVPSIFFLWALFFLVVMNHPFYWWMAPYGALMYYTVFLVIQLRHGGDQPALLLDRLSREPVMGMILLSLAFLLEIALWILITILSVRLERLRKGRKGKNIKRRVVIQQPEQDVAEEDTMVAMDQNEGAPSSASGYVFPSRAAGDEPLSFPKIKELPSLRTIGNEAWAEDTVYIGSVKVREDESVVLADTPMDKIDEPSDLPVDRHYDPIPSLRKQMAEEAALAPIVVPNGIPRSRKKVQEQETRQEEPAIVKEVSPVVTESERRQKPSKPESAPVAQILSDNAVEEIVEEDDGDMDEISGVGGLVSSNAGSSALLSRKKINYSFPPEELLDTYPDHVTDIDELTREAGENLIMTLKQFKIEATLMNIVKGPTVTMFEVSPAPGVRVSSIMSLSDNIALQLAARQVRIVAPIPGKQAVGIEVPNKHRSIIGFKDLLPTIDAKQYQVPMVLGRKITGEPVVIEITQTPHLLIAGATGSGKSVCVNSLISSLLYRRSPKEVRLILVDPKIVELRVYNGIPHLLTPVITDPKKTIKALEFCLYEMDRRYKLLNGLAVRNITAYNKKITELKLARERLPYIVVVIDEFADLMTTVGKELETLLARLAAMARAIGIHLVLATQRPSANVITGIIKSNIPTRIAFMVASQIDSRIIIDETGAEKLLGRGDMLFAPGWDPNSVRIQGAFLSDEEVERIVEYAKTQGEPDYLDEAFFEDEEPDANDDDDDVLDDSSDEALMEKALKIVVERQSASASYLQRRLKIGYNRAARLVEQMEDDGLVGPARGSKPRELLKFPD